MNLRLADIPGQRFECRSCTNCCRDLVVHLTRADIEAIDRQNWGGRIEGAAYVSLGRETVLNHRADGGCVFLRPDGKCRIHAEHGAAAKPLACQLFPFTLEPESGALRAGIRFDCPSVARNEGSPLLTHRPALTTLGRALVEQMPGQFGADASGTRLTSRRELSEGELEGLVRRLDRWLGNEARPLEERLGGVCSLVETLQGARLEEIREQRFGELLDLLMEELPASDAAARPVEPADERQRKLLRQHVFAHLEHIDLRQARASFLGSLAYRWGQLQRSRAITNASEAAASRADGIEPAEELNAQEAERLMTRYVRARILSRSAFGRGYYGWPVLEGLSALLLAVAGVGWVARWEAARAGRDSFGWDELVRAVGLVDRTAGRAGELGAKSAQFRVSYLRREQGLLRLLRAYPIIRR